MSAMLLDTCALLWLGFGDEKLTVSARLQIEQTETVFVSPISLWEISNKYRLGKISLPIPPKEWFDSVRKRYNLTVMPLSTDAAILAGQLPEHHKDPADRMIIATALVRNIPVATADHNFPLYGVDVIR